VDAQKLILKFKPYILKLAYTMEKGCFPHDREDLASEAYMKLCTVPLGMKDPYYKKCIRNAMLNFKREVNRINRNEQLFREYQKTSPELSQSPDHGISG